MSLSMNDQSLINNARDGNLQEVCDLLLAGANVNAQDSKGDTALITACDRKNLSHVALEILKRDNVDVNVKNNVGDTALYRACMCGYSDVALEILKRDNVDVDAKGSWGSTALHWAFATRSSEVALEIFKRANFDVNEQDVKGNTALIKACYHSLDEVALEILKRDNVDVNVKNSDGETALLHACDRKNLSHVALEILKRDNVNVNVKDCYGQSALIHACENGHADVALAILKRDNVDVNAKRRDGRTALYWACYNNLSGVALEILEREDVDVNVKNSDGLTSLERASRNGHADVVREILKRENVDVNAQNSNAETALFLACYNGHADVALEILKRDNVDVNVKDSEGLTALYWACNKSLSDVALEILKRDNVVVNVKNKRDGTALFLACRNGLSDVALEILKQDNVNLNFKDSEDQTALDWAQEKRLLEVTNALLEYDFQQENKIKEERKNLFKVMTSASKDDGPVKLSLQFIKQCTTLSELGSGAFGKVLLAKDKFLPRKFAVKTIKFSPSSGGSGAQALVTFQRELSTLKRFRHPNIIVLYGYNLNVSAEEQFLVFEYAEKGSLDGFFKNDDTRANLPADTRLSIMYQVARALHVLHTGAHRVIKSAKICLTEDLTPRGAADWHVFHRDIKSANICLTEDHTPRLIDCGLAKLVEDENNASPSQSTMPTGSTEDPAFGTKEYMCPEYLLSHGFRKYIPAYDVYSFGVVMAELILGRLNCKPTNVLETYVQAWETPVVDDGWKQLQKDADNKVDWKPDALELVCKIALGCITRSPKGRLSTDELLPMLHHAFKLQGGIRDFESEGKSIDLNALLRRLNTGKRNSEMEGSVHGLCVACTLNDAVVKCKGESHALCSGCLEDKIVRAPSTGGFQLLCLTVGCTSQFTENDICMKIDASAFSLFLHKIREPDFDKLHKGQKEHNELQKETKQDVKETKQDVKETKQDVKETKQVVKITKQVVDEISEGQKKMALALDRYLSTLEKLHAYMDQLNVCPNLMKFTPSAVGLKNCCMAMVRAPSVVGLKNCFMAINGKRKYEVVFLCEHSREDGHEPFEITVDSKWTATALPWLEAIINILKIAGAAAPPPLGVLLTAPAVVARSNTTNEERALIEELEGEGKHGEQKLKLCGDALKMIARKANKKKNKECWEAKMRMVPVTINGKRTTIWVKNEFEEDGVGGLRRRS
ncbi:serine/threonine kinase [Fragilaria crotonensis]|nr:serine/threonine kinase [Fragilaria crotonensis]